MGNLKTWLIFDYKEFNRNILHVKKRFILDFLIRRIDNERTFVFFHGLSGNGETESNNTWASIEDSKVCIVSKVPRFPPKPIGYFDYV